MKDKLVTVNTTYARIALILLALNLLATGYTLTKMQEAYNPQPVMIEEGKSACAGCGREGKLNLRFL
jgi:hypothetical protein